MMFQKVAPQVLQDKLWVKVITLCLILFFVFLGDAVMSFWVPNYVEEEYGPVLMGAIMGFSSVVGLVADLIFPQILRGTTVRKLFFLGIIASLLFMLLLINVALYPVLAAILIGMAVWGIYYEFIGFGEQQFVADSTPLKLHSAVWGVLNVARSLAYFLGPIIAGLTLVQGDIPTLLTAGVFTTISLVILLISGHHHDRRVEIPIHEVSLLKEVGHWAVLVRSVWSVVIMSLLLGLIEATFWTTGAVWTEKLVQQSFWGTFFLPTYMLPPLFVGFVVARFKIESGKKKMAAKFLIAAGIFLALIGISKHILLQLSFVFMASVMASAAFPLIDGVYSDIVTRMGRERRHLIGLSRSTISLAYILGPVSAGWLSSRLGEQLTFAYLGIACSAIAAVLLFVMPKKIKIPQGEIRQWE